MSQGGDNDPRRLDRGVFGAAGSGGTTGHFAVRHLRHGGHVTLPAAYVRDRVQLLYATTAHRSLVHLRRPERTLAGIRRVAEVLAVPELSLVLARPQRHSPGDDGLVPHLQARCSDLQMNEFFQVPAGR